MVRKISFNKYIHVYLLGRCNSNQIYDRFNSNDISLPNDSSTVKEEKIFEYPQLLKSFFSLDFTPFPVTNDSVLQVR